MRLTLVDNLVLPDPTQLDTLDVHPHLGLLSVAAVATAHGHPTTIWDPKRLVRSGELPYDSSLYERSAAMLLGTDPDAIGLTTLGCSFLYTLGVARALKRHRPDLPVLLGGPHATMLARPILERYPVFDVVVRHEAEPTIGAVLAALPDRTFEDIPGISWRLGAEIREIAGQPRVDDLDSLPWLDYDLYPIRALDLDLMRVEAGRGCPFACTFCSTATFFQRRYRLKSPTRLVAEMDDLCARYAPREFKLDHDLFTVDRRKVQAFCREVAGRGHRWHVSARADCVDEELLEQMASAGCVGLYLGVETGSKRMQKTCAKRLDLDLVGPTLDTCQRLGIATTASFITGYPEENREDQDATLDLLGDCFRRPQSSCLPQLHILTPEPGTALFAQYGEQLRIDARATRFNAWMLVASDAEDIRAAPDIFATHYHYPGVLDRREHVLAVEAVDLLRVLSHDLLTALVDRHDGSLASLVAALNRETTGDIPTRAELKHLMLRRFGSTDPLTLAVRYRLFCTTPFDDAASQPPSVVTTSDVYRAPSELQLLMDMPDCEAPGCGTSTQRFAYARWPSHPAPVRLDPPVAELLRCFDAARSLAAILDVLGIDPAQSPVWLTQLVDVGLLIPIPPSINGRSQGSHVAKA
jgi:radical SAM superfamily enzyme YgiQ (UPF0313 family)